MVISSPADGSLVQGPVSVRATVRSSVAVGKVGFYADSRLLATDYRAPYASTWVTRSAPAGSTHTLTAVAYSRSGAQIGQTTIAVTVIAAPVASRTSARRLMAAASMPVVTGAFSDLGESPLYDEAIVALADAAVVSGFDDGRFGAALPTTRAQFAKMISGTLGIADGEATSTPFVDLDPMDADLYPHKYIAALLSVGALEGTSPNHFSPWDSVSRAQLVTILVRALRTLDPGALVEPPADFVCSLGEFNPSHEESMRIAEYNGLLTGLEGFGPAWDPWVPASRGEVAQVLYTLTMLE